MQYNAASSSLFTGSWDCSVRGWDERTAGSVSKLEKMDDSGGKVFSLSTEGNLLVAATSSKQIFIYDTRALHEPLHVNESPLRHQLRSVALSLDATYYVLGSTEARVAVEFIGQEENTQRKNYTFKCHRKDGVAHPINAIAFHPVLGTFVTGGCDGVVNAWDGLRKKRISQLPSYPTSIASLAFNKDGSLLAVAASYTFAEGQQAAPTADDVYIRRLNASEVSPVQRESD
jgi:cell cycle arrest protein BUB3